MTKRVVIGISGGVDSAVSAFLLKEKGYEAIGLTFILIEEQDLTNARKVAQKLGINLIEKNLISTFKEKVINPFLKEYSLGRTPNPCALCNKYIKFPELYKEASRLGADKIATGHYAITREKPFGLFKGRDPHKDQSYFLSLVEEKYLKKTIFPVGEFTKEEIKNLARKIGIDKFVSFKGSQDVCFIREGLKNFIRKKLGNKLKKGVIKDTSGEKLGEHDGISFYTIGQRRRLNIATGKRRYIVKIDPIKNEIIVGDLKDLLKDRFMVKEINWLVPLEKSMEGEVKVRYHTPPSKAKFIFLNGTAEVLLHSPISAIAPGQIATFYLNDQVIWGGIIA